MESKVSAKTKDRQRTREALLRAAQTAFSTRGYRDVGVRDITAAAGVSMALVNRYFGGKQQLYEEALADLLNLDRLLETPRDRFGEGVLHLLQGESGKREVPLAMILLASGDANARAVSQKALTNLVFQRLTEWFGGEEGQVRAARFMILSSSFMLFDQIYPLDAFSPVLDPTLRAWLVREFQLLAD